MTYTRSSYFRCNPYRVYARAILLLAASLIFCLAQTAAAQPLAAWIDGPTKLAIVQFIARVATQGSPDFVTPCERIAVVDDDGTLWVEQPYPAQFVFALDARPGSRPCATTSRVERSAGVSRGDQRRRAGVLRERREVLRAPEDPRVRQFRRRQTNAGMDHGEPWATFRRARTPYRCRPGICV